MAWRFPDSKVHGAHLGPVGARWDPRWPHESCYQGYMFMCGFFSDEYKLLIANCDVINCKPTVWRGLVYYQMLCICQRMPWISVWWRYVSHIASQTTKFMGLTWGPHGSCRPQMGPMNLAIRDIIGLIHPTWIHFFWLIEFNPFRLGFNPIRTICHAQDLWKLAWSCNQLHLLCPPDPWSLPRIALLSGSQSSQGPVNISPNFCHWCLLDMQQNSRLIVPVLVK